MSNLTVQTVTFDGTKLQFVRKGGAGAPLLLVNMLSKALGVAPKSGYWYSSKIKPHIRKLKLKDDHQPIRVIDLGGVEKVLRRRNPLWEQPYRDWLLTIDTSPEEPHVVTRNTNRTQQVIGPDNLHLDDPFPMPVETTLIPTIIKRLEKQDGVIARLTEAVESFRVTTGPTFLDVPRKAKLLHTPITKADAVGHAGRTLHNEPLYAYVPGYLNYKEFFKTVGLDEYVATTFGRVVSSKLSYVCKKQKIRYYLVLDANRLGERSGRYKNAKNVHDSLPNYSINSYPQELWDVMKPVVQQMVDEQREQC